MNNCKPRSSALPSTPPVSNAPKRAPRKPRENIPECTKRVLALLGKNPGRRVTAGWIADRGIGFSEHAIEVCLRALRKKKEVSRVYEHIGGLSYWTWPALPDTQKERADESEPPPVAD